MVASNRYHAEAEQEETEKTEIIAAQSEQIGFEALFMALFSLLSPVQNWKAARCCGGAAEALTYFFNASPTNSNNAFVGGSSGDRKSTRLNSSHITISYAVFCLKKKTKKQNIMRDITS